MKKSIGLFSFLVVLALPLSPAMAETRVTVDDSKVTIDRNAPTTAVVTTQGVHQQPVYVTTTQDPRHLEGEIIKVDMRANQIWVRDAYGRERKVTLKEGMINNYKVDDYVKIYLMADLQEAKTIATQRTADLEGEIVLIDLARDHMVVRQENNEDRTVVLYPGMIDRFKAGDRVRLYVVSGEPEVKEVKIIRVK